MKTTKSTSEGARKRKAAGSTRRPAAKRRPAVLVPALRSELAASTRRRSVANWRLNGRERHFQGRTGIAAGAVKTGCVVMRPAVTGSV